MWDNYYDTVIYEKKGDGLDYSGNPSYSSPISIKVRQVSGGQDFTVSTEGQEVKYTKKYQIPFEVFEGDKIDGHTIVNVENSKDCFGKYHFTIARVI